jgi:hypothetical protein
MNKTWAERFIGALNTEYNQKRIQEFRCARYLAHCHPKLYRMRRIDKRGWIELEKKHWFFGWEYHNFLFNLKNEMITWMNFQ